VVGNPDSGFHTGRVWINIRQDEPERLTSQSLGQRPKTKAYDINNQPVGLGLSSNSFRDVEALQASNCIIVLYPGRCPGLWNSRPSACVAPPVSMVTNLTGSQKPVRFFVSVATTTVRVFNR